VISGQRIEERKEGEKNVQRFPSEHQKYRAGDIIKNRKGKERNEKEGTWRCSQRKGRRENFCVTPRMIRTQCKKGKKRIDFRKEKRGSSLIPNSPYSYKKEARGKKKED